MGEIYQTATPVLRGKVYATQGAGIGESSFKAIVDGKVYTPQYDKAIHMLSLEITNR